MPCCQTICLRAAIPVTEIEAASCEANLKEPVELVILLPCGGFPQQYLDSVLYAADFQSTWRVLIQIKDLDVLPALQPLLSWITLHGGTVIGDSQKLKDAPELADLTIVSLEDEEVHEIGSLADLRGLLGLPIFLKPLVAELAGE
jgi:hypothetical protein